MLTEIYQRESLETSIPELDQNDKELERRAELVSTLGLSGQQRRLQDLEKAKAIPYRLLTQEELRIWQDYLPCSYLEDAVLAVDTGRRPIYKPSRLADYDFDLIPIDVLENWQHCRQLGYFSSYEIWTADNQPDPVLIGRLGSLVFLIARWGESLKPLEGIKQAIESEGRPRRRRIVL
jgi:hypothetical protein